MAARRREGAQRLGARPIGSSPRRRDEPPADPAVRRTDARPPGGLGAVVTAAVRHVRSEAALHRAFAAIDRKDLDGAIAACTEAIRLDPDCGPRRIPSAAAPGR